MQLLYSCYAVAMRLLCGCYAAPAVAVAMLLLDAVAMLLLLLLCSCYAVAMRLLCGCYAVWLAGVSLATLFDNLVLIMHYFGGVQVLGYIFVTFLPNFQTFRFQGDQSFAFSSEFSCH